MRKQNAALFIPLIPATAMAINSSTLPSQRSSERLFLKNLKGTEKSVELKRIERSTYHSQKLSHHIDTGFHGTDSY